MDRPRPAFGFVLLAARDQPTSVTELAGLMGITKQAASKLVDAMISGGYIQRGTDPHDGRQRPVSLPAAARNCCPQLSRYTPSLRTAGPS